MSALAALTWLRSAAVLAAVFTIPGWFVLTRFETWRRWKGLQRWILAIGLSIAFYPILFYWARLALPFLTFGPYKMSALLGVLALVTIWQLRKSWKELFVFDRLEWIAIAVFGLTLLTRWWIIRTQPYPAWSDSLHHTLLTLLTATQGKLPLNMEPYFPVSLGTYHLGLYSISAVVEWLAQVPAHTALLWTAQVLNGLCGIGVYLLLDRKVGRVGAVIGAVVVGLLSHQPAFYVNWGRFTQISAQAILLIAWLVAWETLAQWREGKLSRVSVAWNTGVAALLAGGVVLLHFRVALFYAPLLALSAVWELWQSRKSHTTRWVVTEIAALGIACVVMTAPATWNLLRVYASYLLRPPLIAASTSSAMQEQYFEFPWETVPILVAPLWLLVVTGVSAGFALLRRNRMAVLALLWTISLFLLGNVYRLGMPLLNLTNLGAVLIMLYLPIGLVVGCAAQEVVAWAGDKRRHVAAIVLVSLAFCAGLVAARARGQDLEPYRYFVTPEDVVAMDWIRNNTAPDVVFAVNTYPWLPDSPHGTDAGYWIPYFTGRKTTAGVMLLSDATPDYQTRVVEMSQAAVRLETDNAALDDLRALGVSYVYIGTRGNFSGPGLNAARIGQAKTAKLVYQQGSVSIFQIKADNQR